MRGRIDRNGMFAGYASLFNVRDQGGDIVLPGAFARSLRRKGARGIRMLHQHDPAQPVGVWHEIREDDRGLFVRGRLALGTARGRELAELVRIGALDGLSIGFRTVVAGRDPARRARLLKAVDLWEISLVTFPMMPGARIGGFRDVTHRGHLAAGGGRRGRMPEFLTAKGDGCT